jgi:hypothetical protein
VLGDQAATAPTPLAGTANEDQRVAAARESVATVRAWVATLDDAWTGLSDGDRRAVLQSVRRHVETAAGLLSAGAPPLAR